MSLIPPTAIVMSKIKYRIYEKLKDDNVKRAECLELIGPFPEFQLHAIFRRLDGKEPEIQDIEITPELLDTEKVMWDCVDIALNMMARLKNKIKDKIYYPGILKLAIQQRIEGTIEWSDMFLDEYPLNISSH